MALKQVVLVDDHLDLLEIFTGFVRSSGYDVAAFEDGGAALDFVREHASDVGLVFLDLHMPGHDGYAFLEMRRAERALLTVPVVVLTAVPGPHDFSEASVVRVLEKPAATEILLELLRAHCGTPVRSLRPPRP